MAGRGGEPPPLPRRRPGKATSSIVTTWPAGERSADLLEGGEPRHRDDATRAARAPLTTTATSTKRGSRMAHSKFEFDFEVPRGRGAARLRAFSYCVHSIHRRRRTGATTREEDAMQRHERSSWRVPWWLTAGSVLAQAKPSFAGKWTLEFRATPAGGERRRRAGTVRPAGGQECAATQDANACGRERRRARTRKSPASSTDWTAPQDAELPWRSATARFPRPRGDGTKHESAYHGKMTRRPFGRSSASFSLEGGNLARKVRDRRRSTATGESSSWNASRRPRAAQSKRTSQACG